MLDEEKKRRMDRVVDVRCRSYSGGAFDGCTACVDAALDAVAQAVVYVLGRATPDLMAPPQGPVSLDYRMRVRIYGDEDQEIGSDDLTVQQSIEAVPSDAEESEFKIEPAETEAESGAEADGAAPGEQRPPSTMRLEDFQTVVDRLELAPEGAHCLRGLVAGTLFGYERSIGRFEALIQPR